jgi:hypothetical protein
MRAGNNRVCELSDLAVRNLSVRSRLRASFVGQTTPSVELTMAQWMGQFTGNTHLSKIQDCERQLRHAIDVHRSKEPVEDQQAYSKTVIRFADRLVKARIRAAKAHLSALGNLPDECRRTRTTGSYTLWHAAQRMESRCQVVG